MIIEIIVIDIIDVIDIIVIFMTIILIITILMIFFNIISIFEIIPIEIVFNPIIFHIYLFKLNKLFDLLYFLSDTFLIKIFNIL